MSGPVSVFILDADEQSTFALRRVLTGGGIVLVGCEADAVAAIDSIKIAAPDVIVLDATACDDLPATVRTLVAACRSACIIVTGTHTPAVTMSRAVAAGARGFLLKPYAPGDMLDTITDALVALRGQSPKSADAARAGAKLIAIYSPKGGVGCTTVATNLAVALSARPNTTVGLIDLDLQFGDVAAALDLRTVNSIAELLKADTVTAELIDETFVRHESGVRVLVAPDDLEAVDTIETEQVIKLLDQLRPHFDFLVCDLWSSLDPLTRSVMRIADSVMFVTTPEFPALRDLQRVISSSRSELLLDRRMSVIVNRFPGKAGLPIGDISKALGHPISATIPSEGITVTDAINRGLSLLDSRAKVRLARSYHNLASLTAQPLTTGGTIQPRATVIGVSR
jgi:pilus assembly protein CpaE